MAKNRSPEDMESRAKIGELQQTNNFSNMDEIQNQSTKTIVESNGNGLDAKGDEVLRFSNLCLHLYNTTINSRLRTAKLWATAVTLTKAPYIQASAQK